MFEELIDMYSDWGYMDPSEYDNWASAYGDTNNGQAWVLLEGATNDNQVLFGEGLPTVIAIVEVTTTWTSTLQVKAWEYDKTPQLVWDIIDFCSDNMESEDMDAEEYTDTIWQMLQELRENY